MADEWDLEAITAHWQHQWWDAKVQHAERPVDAAVPWWSGKSAKPTFFLHFAYPGISGYLHVGHMRGFTYTDVFARYKRMTGHNVLFPAGFHASGIPSVAFAADVARGEKTEYLLSNGYDEERDGPIRSLEDPKKVVEYFSKVYTNDYWKKFGFLIDERRNCTTIDPAYGRFIQWQFRQLKAKGYLVQKPHYAPFCPVQGPVAVDKSETDIKQGGSAEIQEFVTLKFTLAEGTVFDEPVILACGTLRPETVYGCTNVWIHPDHEYELVRVWQDGAVGDKDPSEVWLVSQAGRRKLEWQFERAEALKTRVRGKDLVGESLQAPVTGRQVPVVAGTFVDPGIVTGIVMSVPGHAPFDYAAYRDAGLDLNAIPQIVKVEGAPPGLPAKLACDKHKVTNQGDKGQLDAATEEVYAEEFNKGVLTEACGPWAGKRIKGVKDQIKAEFVAAGHARILRQFTELVISRSGEIVDVKRIPDQDFIHYSDAAWTAKAKEHAATMAVHPTNYQQELPNVLDWFGDRACVRRGAWLGTEFPFKPGWIIEPIADSTFYPWYYLVSRYVRSAWNPSPGTSLAGSSTGGSATVGLAVEDLTDAFFDYIFNGKGATANGQPPTSAGAKAATWKQVRDDVLYWGPVDLNLGGKEHQTVHFPVYIMNNVALLDDKRLWPKGIFVNWWVTQKAGAKISKSKGGAEPIPGAAKRYGVDAMRLYYCHVGSPHVDIEWDPDIVLSYRTRVQRIGRIVDDALAATGKGGPMDPWLDSAFHQSLTTAKAAYDASDLRTATTELVYTVPDLIRWYQRRGGANKEGLRQLVLDWAKALCPLVPHLAEEMYHRAGGKGLCTLAQFPEPAAVDAAVLAGEDQVRAVLDDVLTVKKLAAIEAPTKLVLFAGPAWKRDLTAKALRMAQAAGGKFPMGQFMGEVMQDARMRELGKAVQNFTGKLPGQVTQFSAGQRALLLASTDEARLLEQAAAFIGAEVGVKDVQVWSVDDPAAPEHPKRGVAGPLKPGIALE